MTLMLAGRCIAKSTGFFVMKALEIKNLYFTYQGRNDWILKDIDFSVSKGEIVCISGLSGSGKTSFLKTINGLIPKFTNGTFKGVLLLHGENYTNLDVPDISKRVGTVFQNPEFQLINNFVYEEINAKNRKHY